jgi:hypothetical protein
VFIEGDGGGSVEPTFSGPQTLRVEGDSIPKALAAFTKAYDRVKAKVDALHNLQIQPWAADGVSHETATQFQERSQGGGANSAIQCLTGYMQQLEAACHALADSQKRYNMTEDENTLRWTQQPQQFV